MKKLIISNFPIGPKFNGGAMTVWGLVNYFLDKKENFDIFLICDENEKNSSRFNECIKILKNNNTNYKIFFYKAKKINILLKSYFYFKSLFFGDPDFFFPNHVSLKKEIEGHILSNDYEFTICYHFDALSACYDIKNLNSMLGDFIHEPRICRRLLEKKNYFFMNIINWFEELIGYTVMKNLTKKNEFIGFFSNNYAKIFSNKIKKAYYLRTPIIEKENFKQKNDLEFNFLMVGHLQGTVTISSLIFLEKLIQKYEEYLLINRVKFNVVGGNKLTNINKKLVKKEKLVNFHGESYQIDKFYEQSNFLLVPNEVDIGIRVRIITGLSFGAVVITHSSNLKGIPELQDKVNCLVFSSEDEFIDIIKRIKSKNFNLDKLRENAKKTFHENFYYKNSVKKIMYLIENDR